MLFTIPLVFVVFPIQLMSDARAVAEQYVAAALEGKTDDAMKLAAEGQSASKPKKIEEFKELVGKDKLPRATVLASDTKKYALAVTDGAIIQHASDDDVVGLRAPMRRMTNGPAQRDADVDGG